jgi:hypothetical protein
MKELKGDAFNIKVYTNIRNNVGFLITDYDEYNNIDAEICVDLNKEQLLKLINCLLEESI